jgi:hypothetical protein
MAPYPGLQRFLNEHPEVARNPSFFLGEGRHSPRDPATLAIDFWRQMLENVGIFIGFGTAISVLIWLVRTLVDYRRWIRLSKIQTEVHTKILDRLTANNDLLAYIESPAGSKFLESSPINLDAGPRSMAEPSATAAPGNAGPRANDESPRTTKGIHPGSRRRSPGEQLRRSTGVFLANAAPGEVPKGGAAPRAAGRARTFRNPS